MSPLAGDVDSNGNDVDTDACTSLCAEATCGDGFVQDGVEDCDDGNDDDTDGCLSTCVLAVCGDGVVQADVEECDDGNDVETDDCLSTCVAAKCGDGVIQDGVEDCDGADLGGVGCGDLGFFGGELACSDQCQHDTAACSNCGDDVLDDDEVCDGADLGGQSCVGLGHVAGQLSCSATCDAFVEDACVATWWGDDFEAGALGPEWVLSGSANWFASGTNPHAGAWNGENGNIGDSQTSTMEVSLSFAAAGSVTFWRRTSTEGSWDYLRFYIDGVQQASWSGTLGWAEFTYPVPAGDHTLRWSYTKDGSVSSGSDTVWVDDITTINGLLP